MIKSELISIIVPVYNTGKYLDRCIKSLINQTYNNLEIILVNDGSTDNSKEICDFYTKRHLNIVAIHKENGGLSDARNFGIEISKGDYIGFVDADDYVSPNMYDDLYNSCKEYNSDISMCGRFDVINGLNKSSLTLPKVKKFSSTEALARLLKSDKIDSSVCDKIFKKRLFANLRFPLKKYNEDIFITSKLIHLSKSIVHIGKPLYYYYHRDGSITSENYSEKKLDLLEASKDLKLFINEFYPSLNKLADLFYYKGLIFLAGLITKSNNDKYRISKKILMDSINASFLRMFFLTNLPFPLKIKLLLLITNTYSIFIKYLRN
jgi:glycosyltransferase involved in cell wall biosynthesis